jgi:hypothetical protein
MDADNVGQRFQPVSIQSETALLAPASSEGIDHQLHPECFRGSTLNFQPVTLGLHKK